MHIYFDFFLCNKFHAVLKPNVYSYIGLDKLGGFAEPSIVDAWPKVEQYASATSSQMADQVASGEVTVVDVRADQEWDAGHLPNAKHIMLGYLEERVMEIPTDKPVLVHCRSGARSAIAASLLQAKGITNVINLQGGYLDWHQANLPVSYNGAGHNGNHS